MKRCDHAHCPGLHPDDEEFEILNPDYSEDEQYRLGAGCEYNNSTGYCGVTCCIGYGCTHDC